MIKINSANETLEERPVHDELADKFIELFAILGLDVRPDASEQESEMADLLLDLREDAREREDYNTSDFIRDRLEELGFDIEDTEEGGFWVK
jgi:cysteinyl-tRNA synthetase